MKIYVAHSQEFDFENKLYAPLRTSHLNTEHDIFLPHENEPRENMRDKMNTFELMIAEVSLPSTGEGIEIGRAEAVGLPILCIHEKGAKISSSLKFVTEHFLEYTDPESMISGITKFLQART